MKKYESGKEVVEAAVVNGFKADEERLLRKLDALSKGSLEGSGISMDGRWLAIGRTALEQAFMAINRAVFQPGRVAFPEDVDGAD